MMRVINKLEHIAIIMDGNGRWAQSHGLARTKGHVKGVSVIEPCITVCIEKNIHYLTLFAFGKDNAKRPKSEVYFLHKLLAEQLVKQVDKLIKEGIRLVIIGDIDALDEKLAQAVVRAQERTKNGDRLCLTVAINYSGLWDIEHAVRQIAADVQTNKICLEDINQHLIRSNLNSHQCPAIDLLIRTSGECRISNFMLWQLAYSELYFTKCPWPDFTADHLTNALDWYKDRERRFGKISAQVSKTISSQWEQDNDRTG